VFPYAYVVRSPRVGAGTWVVEVTADVVVVVGLIVAALPIVVVPGVAVSEQPAAVSESAAATKAAFSPLPVLAVRPWVMVVLPSPDQ
jgi:hypothetical protein